MDAPALARRRALFQAAALATLTRALPSHARTPGALPLIVFMEPGAPGAANPWTAPLREALAALGWVEGRTVRMETLYGESRPEQMLTRAREAVARQPDVIFTHGSGAMVRNVASATATIPIIVGVSGDLVALGLARSFSRPGGNVTGMTIMDIEPESKRLGLLREALPASRRVGILVGGATTEDIRRLIDEPVLANARSLGFQARVVRAPSPAAIRSSMQTLARDSDVLLSMDGPMLAQTIDDVAREALALRLPSISQTPRFADAGGLLQYGADVIDMFRRSARYVDKVLRGASPGELPIEQPTTYKLVVNLKSATTLGLTLPVSVLARADRVIE